MIRRTCGIAAVAALVFLVSAHPAGAQMVDSFNPGADADVFALVVQPDGKIVIGGDFTLVASTPRQHLARLNPDGSLDMTFDPGANGTVAVLALQPDGKILVGGGFTTLGGGGSGTPTRNRIGRLNPNGSLDTSFDPGADSTVWALARQPDGKIVVGGMFTTLGGGGTGTTPRNYIGRLNPDGSPDTAFDPGANNYVRALTLQADGKILIGGYFTMLGGGGIGTTTRNYLGRLNTDGGLDTSFDPGANNYVRTFAVQPDAKILVGGSFSTIGGGGTGASQCYYLARLNANGSVDPGFSSAANNDVRALLVQYDLRIVVAGTFTTLGAGSPATRYFIGRLNVDGSVDPGWDPGANAPAWTVAMQPDSKIVVGGNFATLGGGGVGTAPRSRVGRLLPGARAILPAGDFDGDHKADVAVFRPAESAWYIRYSADGRGVIIGWGTAGDIPVPGDYDGDGKTDVAVFRPADGGWYVVKSSGGGIAVAWGAAGDIPVPADYDGDGKTDFAVFRPSQDAWYILRTTEGAVGWRWGTTGDVPVPGDYDGDGRADIAVFRPSQSAWYPIWSGGGIGQGYFWGTVGDLPVVADFDGDHVADIGVFRPSEGGWYFRLGATGGSSGLVWGTTGDAPVFGDFDGDGKADFAVFRESDGGWYIMQSSTKQPMAIVWGTVGDLPV